MKKTVVQFAFGLFTFLCCQINVHAVPAYPNKVTVRLENGKSVAIYMRGDEFLKFASTEEGYTVIGDSAGWWYATLTDAGIVVKSDFKLMSDEDETVELKCFKAECPKGLVPEKEESNRRNRTNGQPNRIATSGAIVGERRALVILMQFKDLAFKKGSGDFETLFNMIGYRQDGATGSVRDYYRFASQGQLDYISDIYGPYTSQNPMRYYGGNSMDGGSDKNPLELCIEAIKSLPDSIDFSVYDNDGDGLVDNVHIIYAGYGEEAGASTDAIWAHEFPHRISLRNEVGYSFAGYSCSPELRGNNGSKITNIGVICHELGHALGAMDYYDTNYGTGGEYEGTGKWDIMASGSWNDNGRTPPNFNPFVRSNVFGWNQQKILEGNKLVSMPRIEIDNAENAIVYRVNTGSDGDYFLLENRQQYLFDTAIPGSGMMIYHVHPNIDRYHTTNTVNTTHPQGLYPVCASYSEPSKKKYGNINSAECPFPGNKNVRDFSPSTSPSAVAWNGSAATVSISHITMNPSDGTITFSTGEDSIEEPDIPETETKKIVIYKESFETATKSRILISSIFGKGTWQTYKKGDFVVNADFLPEPTDGENILMLFSGKGNTMNESEAASPDIEIEASTNYYIAFDLYCESVLTSPPPLFNLYVEDEYGEYNIFTLNEATSEWNKVEIPLVFGGNKFKYKIYGRIFTGGLFVDNLRLYRENESSSILNNFKKQNSQVGIYRIDGTRLLNNSTHRGIIIVRQEDGKTIKVVQK